jgi:hypothetical protein
VSEFTNNFHNLRTKLGIKGSEWNLFMKYLWALHRYIQTKMDFPDISLLGYSYRYVVKIEQKFRHQKKREFSSTNPQQPKNDKDNPNKHPIENHPKPQKMKGNGKTKKDISTNAHGKTLMNFTQKIHCWLRSKTRSQTPIQNLIQKIMGQDRSSMQTPLLSS